VFIHKQKKKKVRLGKKKKKKEEYTIEDEQYTQECLCVIFNDVVIYILNLKHWYHFDDD